MADSVVWTLTDETYGVTVTMTATVDGDGFITLAYELVGGYGDLNGLYIDFFNDGGLINTLGPGNNMNGAGADGFDYAVALGSVGGSDTDVVSGDITDLTWADFTHENKDGQTVTVSTLEELAEAEAGFRITSVGEVPEDREGSLKLTAVGEFCPEEADPKLEIEKTIRNWEDTNGNGKVDAGDVINYDITVRNLGNVELTEVEVNDPLLSETPLATGITLAVGGDATYGGSYTITQEDIDSMGDAEEGDDTDDNDLLITNTATATSIETGEVSDTEDKALDYNPVLAIDKTITGWEDTNENGKVDAGDVISYKVVVENKGNVTLTGVQLNDPLLSDVALYSDVTLAVNGSKTYTGSYTITQDDIDSLGDDEAGDVIDDDDLMITNIATATSNETGEETDTENVEIDAIAELSIDKVVTGVDTDGDGKLNKIGDMVSYDIIVQNTGTRTLTNVTVTDALTGVNEVILELAPGAIATIPTSYTLTEADVLSDVTDEPDDVSAGELDNTASAFSDQTEVVSDSESVPVIVAELDIEKQIRVGCGEWMDADSADDLLELLATKGDIEYRVVLTNTGATDLTGVIFWDPALGIPEYLVGDIAVGADVILGVEQFCEMEICWQEGAVFNTAFADSDQTDEVQDDANFFGAVACIDIEKVTLDSQGNMLDGQVVQAGTDVTWQFAISNTGNVGISNFALWDDAGTEFMEHDDILVIDYVAGETDIEIDGDTNDNGVLDVDETWTFTLDGQAALTDACDTEGKYTNDGVVWGSYTDDAGVTRDLLAWDSSTIFIEGGDGGDTGGDTGGDGEHCDDDGHNHDHNKDHDWHHGDDRDNDMDGCEDRDWFKGHDGNDKMLGYGGRDKMHGGRGRDEIHGGKGGDDVRGGAGKDRLHGEQGEDLIVGGRGNDKMWGGGGCDVFEFGNRDGRDAILDFDAKGSSHDVIDLSEVSAIRNWRDLKNNHLEEDENGVRIKCDDVEIFLKGVDLGHLDRGDFIF